MSTAPRLRVLLLAQAAFMVGFSSVVPFIAVLADARFGLGPAAIGAIVGARVAVQQGLFLVGGALADRFGPRALLLSGCAVRAAGFVLLAFAPTPAVFVAAVLIIGVAGALFSPAVDAYVGAVDTAVRSAPAPVQTRPIAAPTPFAALALAGEAGGIVGAVVGAVMMPVHAVPVVVGASIVFAIALAVLAGLLPGRETPHGTPLPRARPAATPPPSTPRARPGRAVILSATGAATVLAVYTQLFSLLPTEMAARDIDGGWVGGVSVVLSVTILTLQWPLSRLVERLTRPRAVVVGVAAALLAALVGAGAAATADPLSFAGAAVLATIATAVAIMLATPSAQSLLAGAGSDARRATRLGALASGGGLLALGASTLSGAVAAGIGLPAAGLTAALLPAAGLVFACIGARTPADSHPRKDHHDHPSPILEDRPHRSERPRSARPVGLLRRRLDGARRGIR